MLRADQNCPHSDQVTRFHYCILQLAFVGESVTYWYSTFVQHSTDVISCQPDTISRRIDTYQCLLTCFGTRVAFIAIALTAPMIAATAPAVLGLAALVVAFLFWPRHRNRKVEV